MGPYIRKNLNRIVQFYSFVTRILSKLRKCIVLSGKIYCIAVYGGWEKMEKVLNEDSSSIEISRLDSEWRNLLLEAKSIGLTVKEVRAFFQEKKE